MSLARRWAETLIAAVLNVPHEELTAHARQTLNLEQRRRFEGIARQASPDAPLAYAIGRAPFMDLDFEVSPDTLIPKVDTELFVGTMLDELACSPLPPEPHVHGQRVPGHLSGRSATRSAGRGHGRLTRSARGGRAERAAA